jgi:hypothetical protein
VSGEKAKYFSDLISRVAWLLQPLALESLIYGRLPLEDLGGIGA